MAIIALKAWYIKQYEPLKQVLERPCDLRLSRSSLLKTGMRADFLDERIKVETTDWFAIYLESAAPVEFYIEGSGYYTISNIDLVSQEIYFTKQQSLSGLEPIIYFSPQTEYSLAETSIRETLDETISILNKRSRIPLKLEIAPRQDTPLRLSRNQFKTIRKSLLYIADSTPIATIPGKERQNLLLDSNVCIEMGYALETKDMGHILLLRMEREDLTGEFPFDVSSYKELIFQQERDLQKNLPQLVETLLQRFALLT